ncbi:MAG: amidohydrolase family protein [Candidatus Bipolaricaulia bacterium]
MIIDSHLHLPPVGDSKDFKKAKGELISEMARAGIDYAVVIPDNIQGSDIGDLGTVLGLVEDEPRLFALGAIDVKKQGADWLDKLDKHLKEGKIKGIKIFPGHEPIYPTDERYKPLYKLCSKYDYPVVVHTGANSDDSGAVKYNDPKHIVEVAKDFPKLKVVIAHYFWPQVEYCFEVTKRYDNIFYDTSALADKEVLEKTGEEEVKNVLEKTLANDSQNVLFGTDFSICDCEAHLDLVDSLDISESVRERVLWKNASDVFNLDQISELQ